MLWIIETFVIFTSMYNFGRQWDSRRAMGMFSCVMRALYRMHLTRGVGVLGRMATFIAAPWVEILCSIFSNRRAANKNTPENRAMCPRDFLRLVTCVHNVTGCQYM